MKAIILAAGQGTRLKKYTEDLPKGMLSFMGETIIQRQIAMYKCCGINKIIVIRGFAADKIDYRGITYYTNEDYADTNMVESFMAARTEFDDDVIVSYSDILVEQSMLKAMMQSEADFAVAVDTEWKPYWEKRYGIVDYDTESLVLDGKDNIVELGLERPRLEDIDARYIGLLKFSKLGLKHIEDIMKTAYETYQDRPWQQSGKTVRKAYMTDLLNAVIESGREVKAVQFQHGWIEFDTNEDYEKACRWVEDGTIREVIEI